MLGSVAMAQSIFSPSVVVPSGDKKAILNLTGSGSISQTNSFLKFNSTATPAYVNLPTAVGQAGKSITIQKITSDTNGITIDPLSTQTINGLSTIELKRQYESVNLISDGSNWLSTNIGGAGIYTVTSDTKTPSGDGFQTMSNNSIALPPGTYELSGVTNFTNGGVSPSYTYMMSCLLSNSSNAILSSASNLTVLGPASTGLGANGWCNEFAQGTSGSKIPFLTTYIRCSASCTVYWGAYAEMSGTDSNGRITTSGVARRIGN